MALDWMLASLHHLAIFALAAILAAELALMAGDLDGRTILRLARIDSWFGACAALVMAVGLARVFFGAKGPVLYAFNMLFWVKMALFAGVATVSVLPTLRYIVWRRRVRDHGAYKPHPAEIDGVRRALWAEAALFALMTLAAAAIARGYGM
jgi:putative membrane protein